MSLILAIESSCDEMAMAVLKDKRDFLASVIASQIDVHALYGGVVPEKPIPARGYEQRHTRL